MKRRHFIRCRLCDRVNIFFHDLKRFTYWVGESCKQSDQMSVTSYMSRPRHVTSEDPITNIKSVSVVFSLHFTPGLQSTVCVLLLPLRYHVK